MKFMGATISTLHYPAVLRAIEDAIVRESSIFITTPNPEMLLKGLENPDFQNLLGKSDYGVVDGFGLQMILRMKGVLAPRVSGVTLLQNLVRDLSIPIVFIGNEQVVAAARQFSAKNIITIIAPHFVRDDEICAYADSLTPQLPERCAVFVGLGMGKQELLVQKLLQKKAIIGMGVGGAFDMIAGVLPRAPKILQRFGLEWMWRLWLQPSRFSRIVKAVIVFPCKALFYPVSYE